MRTTASGWVRTMGVLAQAEGLDAPALFATQGLSYSLLQNHYTRVAQDTITRLWQQLVAQTGNPAIGLGFGRHVTPATFGAVGYVLLSCRTVKDSLDQLMHYQHFLGEGLLCTLQLQGERYFLRFDGLGDQHQISTQALEAKLSAYLHFARWVTHTQATPLQVNLQHALNAPAPVYEDLFGCPVATGAEFTGVWLSSAFVHQPLPTHDPLMLQQHIRLADDMMQQAYKPLTLSVTRLLRDWLPLGKVGQRDVAEALAMSPKTLQRRLQLEDSRFSTLLDACRHEAALAYLAQPEVVLAEVAELTGFADYSAFAKAFRRYTGVTPTAWRAARPDAR